MSKYEKIAISLSAIIAVAGLACGLSTKGMNFARSGALIVIVGVIYGLLDLPSRLAEIDSWAKNEGINAKPKLLASMKAEGVSDEDAEKVFEQVLGETIIEINAAARNKRKWLVFVEGAILVLGTLIWGFGDLVNPV